MSYARVDFDDGEFYVGNRPVGLVVLRGPGGPYGNAVRFDAVVDTGADYTQLPAEAAARIGIRLEQATPIQIATASGPASLVQMTVTLDIQGTRVQVPVNFAPGSPPLIGRQAIFEFLDTVGFSTNEWLLDRIVAPAPRSPKAKSGGASRPPPGMSSPQRAGRITDYGTWIDIDGLRVDKNRLIPLMGGVIPP